MKKIHYFSPFSLFGLAFLFQFPLAGEWIERKAEGWAWYEDAHKKTKQEIEATPMKEINSEMSIPQLIPPSFSAAEKAAQIRKDVEEKLAQAVLEPTEENIENYMREQQKWINQSVRFSSTWAKVLLQQPNLDATNEFPVSQYGIQLYKQIEQDKRADL